MKCPICGSEDYVQFVFVLHVSESGLLSKDNPSDDHWLYMCPDRHIYNEDMSEGWYLGPIQ